MTYDPIDTGPNDSTADRNLGTSGDPIPETFTEDLNNSQVAQDGSALETLVSNYSEGDHIGLKPNTVYEISSGLSFDDTGKWALTAAGKSRLSATIKPTGDFTALSINGTGTGSGNLADEWRVAGISIDATNLTNTTDAVDLDYLGRCILDRVAVENGSPRDGFHFGQADSSDRGGGLTMRNCAVFSSTRYDAFIGASSVVRINECDFQGSGNFALRTEDASNLWVTEVQTGNQTDYYDIRAPTRDISGITLENLHAEGAPTNRVLDVGADGTSNNISNIVCRSMQFPGANVDGARVQGGVESITFDACNFAQGAGSGTAIDVPTGSNVDNVVVLPNQMLQGDSLDVNDPDDKIHYGWDDFDENAHEIVSGVPKTRQKTFASGVSLLARSTDDYIRVLNENATAAIQFEDGSTVRQFTQDLTAGSAPAPSANGVFATHDGTGTPTAGLYESDPSNNQWVGIGTASGDTIAY